MIGVASLHLIDRSPLSLECSVTTPSLFTLAVLALAVLALSGCRLDLTAVAELERDGSGEAALVVRMDEAMLDELDRLAVDPTIEVTAAAMHDDAWTLDRTVDEEQAITIRLSLPFDDPNELGDAFRGLTEGLADEDPAFLVDLDVVLAEDGGSRVDGTVGFRGPRTTGTVVDGDPVGPSAEELQAHLDGVVVPRLELTLPGTVTVHDGDRLDGRTITWDVPTDGSRAVAATADAPGVLPEWWPWIAVAVGVAALLGSMFAAVRHRSGRGSSPTLGG